MKTCKKILLRQIALFGAAFIPASEMRKKFREWIDDKIINLYQDEIEQFISKYPKVLSKEETIRHIIKNRSSICRFGDGEFKLIIGEVHKSYQDIDEDLNARMVEVLNSTDPNIMIGINQIISFETIGRVWRKFIIRIGKNVLQLLDNNRVYFASDLFRKLPSSGKEDFIDRVRLIKHIWDNRKIVIIVGENARFTYEEELFNNATSVDFIYTLPKNAFSEYAHILKEVRAYKKEEYLILPVLGPTATVLAYDLAKEGYQAIDFGHMSGTFRRIKKELYGSEDYPISELLSPDPLPADQKA